MMNKQKLSEIAHRIWSEYSSKGKLPPVELIEKFRELQGKPYIDIKQKREEENEKKHILEKTTQKQENKQKKIDKLFMYMWKKYNVKGNRPPIELVRKLSILQGKSKEEVANIEYPYLTKGLSYRGIVMRTSMVKFYSGDLPPHDRSTMFPQHWLGYNKHPKRINLTTTIKEVLTK